MIRVAVVDDEPLVRAGLRAMIAAEPDLEVVGEAEDGWQALTLARRAYPHVVLMDLRMPKVDGIQATAALLDLESPPKVVVVTTFEHDDHVYDALRAGASGFLLKRSRPEDILAAIRIVHAGDTLLFPAAIRSLAARRRTRQAGSVRGVDALTERESATLVLMARGRSNAEIAQEFTVGHETVKTHVSNVLTKLGVRDRTQAVIAAYEAGLVGSDQGR